MKTVELFKSKTVLSYEVFPPKPTSSVRTIYQTLCELRELSPDFISVTYSAGRERQQQRRNVPYRRLDYGIRHGKRSAPAVHWAYKTRRLRKAEQAEKHRCGKHSGAARRPAAGNCAPGDFEHASDLIAFIKEQGEFNIIAACYPEGHVEAKNKVEDIQNLKRKVDAGTDQLITQLFFDNEYFYSFAERCALAGIDVPIEAGIMPVVNKRQIERMSSLCGATVPKKFTAMMERYEHNPVPCGCGNRLRGRPDRRPDRAGGGRDSPVYHE